MRMTNRTCRQDEDCASGRVCDHKVDECRVALKGACDKNREKFCVRGTICDVDSVCKLDLNEDCSGKKVNSCANGTVCDWIGRCSQPLGQNCTGTDSHEHNCVAGARCMDSVCACDGNLAKAYNHMCEPLGARYGGACGLECEIDNSECVEGVCECKAYHVPDREFNCVGKNLLRSTEDNSTAMVDVLGPACSLLLVLIVVGAVLHRRHSSMAIQQVQQSPGSPQGQEQRAPSRHGEVDEVQQHEQQEQEQLPQIEETVEIPATLPATKEGPFPIRDSSGLSEPTQPLVGAVVIPGRPAREEESSSSRDSSGSSELTRHVNNTRLSGAEP